MNQLVKALMPKTFKLTAQANLSWSQEPTVASENALLLKQQDAERLFIWCVAMQPQLKKLRKKSNK